MVAFVHRPMPTSCSDRLASADGRYVFTSPHHHMSSYSCGGVEPHTDMLTQARRAERSAGRAVTVSRGGTRSRWPLPAPPALRRRRARAPPSPPVWWS
jgi:hypothetical protein